MDISIPTGGLEAIDLVDCLAFIAPYGLALSSQLLGLLAHDLLTASFVFGLAEGQPGQGVFVAAAATGSFFPLEPLPLFFNLESTHGLLEV